MSEVLLYEMTQVTRALSTLRIGVIRDEYALQEQIGSSLTEAGVTYRKEYQLGKGMRVDFLTSGGVAIEVKKGKPNRAMLEGQIDRYAKAIEVAAVYVVIETGLQFPFTRTGNGKPCRVIGLNRLWGVAL